MEFRDFENNPKELLFKTVLLEQGYTYSDKISRTIVKIEKVTKTGFKLFQLPDTLFNLIDGSQKGLTKADIGYVSKCRLLTDEEADEIRAKWRKNKAEKALREKMLEKVKTMTFEQLQQMDLI